MYIQLEELKAMYQPVQLPILIISVSPQDFSKKWIMLSENLGNNKGHISGCLKTLITFK